MSDWDPKDGFPVRDDHPEVAAFFLGVALLVSAVVVFLVLS